MAKNRKDIWQNLFEFYLVETDSNPAWTKKSVKLFFENQFGAGDFEVTRIYSAESQQLTHRISKVILQMYILTKYRKCWNRKVTLG